MEPFQRKSLIGKDMRAPTADEYLGLAHRINEAALDPSGWGDVIAHLSDMSGGVKTHMFGYDTYLGRRDLKRLTYNYDPAFLSLYQRHFETLNPWGPAFVAGAPGQVQTAEEMFPTEALRRTEFYNDWVRPQEDIIGGAGGVLLRDRNRVYAIGGNIRARDAAETEPFWARLLSGIMPLLQQALDMNRALAGVKLGSYLLRQRIDPEESAVVVLEANGRMVSLNARAAAEVEAAALLRLDAGGRLILRDPAAEARLETMRLRPSGGSVPQGFYMPGATPGGRRWRCHLARLDAEAALARIISDAHFVNPPLTVLVMVPEAETTPVDRLGARLGLTPTEAEVALLLAEGLSPAEISARRGTAVQTVRNQIKQALAKAGCHRQAELVRRVLSMDN